MEDDNIFVDDDALDCILYRECERESGRPSGGPGCLGLLLVLLVPAGLIIMQYLRA